MGRRSSNNFISLSHAANYEIFMFIILNEINNKCSIMGDVKVCHVCLIMDVKMYDLQTPPIDAYFEQLIGANLLVTYGSTELPPYICYECGTLLKKYYDFRQKCLQAQAILYGLVDNNGKITTDKIKQINRDEFQVASTLSHTHITEESAIHYIYNNTVNSSIKVELDDDSPKIPIVDAYVKEEGDDDFPSLDQGFSSDEDEPLSHHKEKKVRKKAIAKKRKLVVEKIEKDEGFEITQYLETNEDIPVLEMEMPEVLRPRKRGRPKKIKVEVPIETKMGRTKTPVSELDEFVTVINLTVEEQMEEINKRQHSSNYLNSPYQCNLCYKGFIDTDAWQHHVSKHAPSAGDIECPICKFRFKTKRALQKHASNHEKKYACKSCSYISTNTTQARQHQRWHKGVTYKCQYCEDIFSKWTSYMSHVRIKHPSEFICGVCGYSYVSKLGLTMHKTMMHKDYVEKPEDNDKNIGHYCEECDVKFVSAEAWKRHLVMSVKHTISTDSIKGCRMCGETFKSAEELRLHHRKQHARKRPKNYGKKPANTNWPSKCEHCSEEIPNARQYWTHFRRVHPDQTYPIQKNYVCDICGKSFRGNAFLVYHKRTHFEERPYKCSVCGKAFYNRTNLHVHEKTHSDTRPYPCSVCFKAFKGKGALDRHFRSHTGLKPYECEVCGKAFSQSNSRKLHVRTVHLKQPAPYVSRTRLERRTKPHPTPHAQNTTPTQQFIY